MDLSQAVTDRRLSATRLSVFIFCQRARQSTCLLSACVTVTALVVFSRLLGSILFLSKRSEVQTSSDRLRTLKLLRTFYFLSVVVFVRRFFPLKSSVSVSSSIVQTKGKFSQMRERHRYLRPSVAEAAASWCKCAGRVSRSRSQIDMMDKHCPPRTG